MVRVRYQMKWKINVGVHGIRIRIGLGGVSAEELVCIRLAAQTAKE